MEGPAVAAPMLQQCGADERESERVQWLIAHHHTYTAGEEKDFRILLEADFLVNAYEDGMTAEQCKTAKDRVFQEPKPASSILKKCFSNRHIRRNNGKLKMETPPQWASSEQTAHRGAFGESEWRMNSR